MKWSYKHCFAVLVMKNGIPESSKACESHSTEQDSCGTGERFWL